MCQDGSRRLRARNFHTPQPTRTNGGSLDEPPQDTLTSRNSQQVEPEVRRCWLHRCLESSKAVKNKIKHRTLTELHSPPDQTLREEKLRRSQKYTARGDLSIISRRTVIAARRYSFTLRNGYEAISRSFPAQPFMLRCIDGDGDSEAPRRTGETASRASGSSAGLNIASQVVPCMDGAPLVPIR